MPRSVFDAEGIKEEGNALFKQGNFLLAVEKYTEGLNADPAPETKVILHSNRAAAYLRVQMWQEAREDARQGLRTSASASKALLQKLRKREQDAALGSEVANNAARTMSLGMRIADQTSIAPYSLLWQALNVKTMAGFFYDGQFCKLAADDASPRFIATVFSITCVTIFAIGPEKQTFAAHITNSNLLSSCRLFARGKGRGILADLATALSNTFKTVNPTDVTLHLVGGHSKCSASNAGLKAYFPHNSDMWNFSTVIRNAMVEALPGAKVCQDLFGRFEGVEERAYDMPTTERLCKQGQRFEVLALDRDTGLIVTHTTFSGCATCPDTGRLGPVPRYVVMEHAEWVSGRRAGGPKSSDPMVQVSFGLDHDCVGATRIAARGSESIDRSDVAALSLSDMDHPFWQERERKAMEVARAVIKAQEDANPWQQEFMRKFGSSEKPQPENQTLKGLNPKP